MENWKIQRWRWRNFTCVNNDIVHHGRVKRSSKSSSITDNEKLCEFSSDCELLHISSRVADVLIYILHFALWSHEGKFAFLHIMRIYDKNFQVVVSHFFPRWPPSCFYVADILNFHMWLESLVSSTQIELQLFLIFSSSFPSLALWSVNCELCVIPFSSPISFFAHFPIDVFTWTESFRRENGDGWCELRQSLSLSGGDVFIVTLLRFFHTRRRRQQLRFVCSKKFSSFILTSRHDIKFSPCYGCFQFQWRDWNFKLRIFEWFVV